MVVTTSYNQLEDAQAAIKNLHESNPSIYSKFLNIIKLTRQMQFGYQYMGTLLMDEEGSNVAPKSQDEYILAVYESEVEKLKADHHFYDLKELLKNYKEISYKNISRLALGEKPNLLVGPTVIR